MRWVALFIVTVLMAALASWYSGKSDTMPLGPVTFEARCFIPIPRASKEAVLNYLWTQLSSSSVLSAGPKPTRFTRRTDTFVNLRMDDVGIKFRHGSDLELKARVNHDQSPSLPEEWHKTGLSFKGKLNLSDHNLFLTINRSVADLPSFTQKDSVSSKLTELAVTTDVAAKEFLWDLDKEIAKIKATIRDSSSPLKISFEVCFVTSSKDGSFFISFNLEKGSLKQGPLINAALHHLVDLTLASPQLQHLQRESVIWGGYPHFVQHLSALSPSSASSSSSAPL